MRKVIVIICLLIVGVTYAQSGIFGVGVKGGLNFSSNGDISNSLEVNDISSDSNIGFHLGAFAKVNLVAFYVRPELMYTKTTSTYETNGADSNLNISKLDLPVLLGFNLPGPIHLFVGPSFQYLLDTDLEDVELSDVEKDFTVGYQVGAGLNLGKKFGVDLRYEGGFRGNDAELLNEFVTATIDTRPSQFILGVSYKLL